MPLRIPQTTAVANTKKAYDEKKRRGIIVQPTGTGKTVVMAHIPQAIGQPGKWLVLAHRKELIKQAKSKIARWNPTLRIGIEMGEERCDHTLDQVVVASKDSLHPTRLAEFNPADYVGIMVDECHHVTTDNSYADIFKHFGVDKSDCRIILIGVTATDMRPDGKPLSDTFDHVYYKMTMFEAVQQGWIVPPRGYKVTTHVSLDGVKITAGDFNQKQLQKAVNTPERNEMLVQTWLEVAKDRQTIAFTVDIQHAKDLAAAFKAHGVRAEAVWGVDPDRDRKIADHQSGKLQVLCNADVLSEGYDDWRVSCVIEAKPTKSALRYTQHIGRGTRLPDTVDNLVDALKAGMKLSKVDLLVIDAVDNSSKHSLMTLSSIAGLNPLLDLRGRAVFEVKKQLEDLQNQHPNFNAAGLTDVNKIEKIVEEVDLWKVQYPEEILHETQNKWFKTFDGQYILAVAANQGIRIWQNLLDKWFCHFKVGENEYHEGDFMTRRDALAFADRMLKLVHPQHYFFRRGSAAGVSAGKPATLPQLSMLKGLGIIHPPVLSKDEASALITQWKAKHFTLKPKGPNESRV